MSFEEGSKPASEVTGPMQVTLKELAPPPAGVDPRKRLPHEKLAVLVDDPAPGGSLSLV